MPDNKFWPYEVNKKISIPEIICASDDKEMLPEQDVLYVPHLQGLVEHQGTSKEAGGGQHGGQSNRFPLRVYHQEALLDKEDPKT